MEPDHAPNTSKDIMPSRGVATENSHLPNLDDDETPVDRNERLMPSGEVRCRPHPLAVVPFNMCI